MPRLTPRGYQGTGLSSTDLDQLVSVLASRLSGWVVPHLRPSFSSALRIRLTDALQTVEQDRTLSLSAYLEAERILDQYARETGLDLDQDHEEEEGEEEEAWRFHQEQCVSLSHSILAPPVPLHLASSEDKPPRRTRTTSSEHRYNKRAIGAGLRTGKVRLITDHGPKVRK